MATPRRANARPRVAPELRVEEIDARSICAFWSRVDRTDGCWSWNGMRSASGGYGVMYVHAPKRVRAHRVSFALHFGRVPAGRLVLHRCDNPSCVNPDHLFLGSHEDNMADMAAKGRARTADRAGARNPRAKLTAADVAIARALFSARLATAASLAERFGISLRQVRAVLRGDSWREHRAA